MRVTKLEHACLRLTKSGQTLLVDPGGFTAPVEDLDDVIAVVLTHEHADHWTPAQLDRIRAARPDVPIYGPAGVVAAAVGYDIIEISPGDAREVGAFSLRFFGGTHAVIHESMPLVDNVGILVDETFYYPGDSYAVPDDTDIALLAAPIGAPWLKIGDAMDFVLAVAAPQVFATHDRTLSELGLGIGHGRLQWATEQRDGQYHRLHPGESIEI
ncbi:MBL fold metallo-hydrolase [Microbacterium sp.]|uniref:MBL fold metallo-hydrolase n=1 Tax=Microbacterium sp. TaxID=51671 RepID=UPI003A8BD79B